MKKERVLISCFVKDAFEYSEKLRDCAIENSVNPYLLEFIANGFAKYETVDHFVDNMDRWLRSVIEIFKEVRFNHDTNQLYAVIDLKDQLVVIDEHLMRDLDYVIAIQRRYGLLIHYQSEKLNLNKQTTLLHFFDDIEKYYPTVKSRYKGLGSSPARVSRETIMDPNTRRCVQVSAEDMDTYNKLSVLVGKGKNNIRDRKEALMNFKFDITMIDN